jgi:hypothetical protein
MLRYILENCRYIKLPGGDGVVPAIGSVWLMPNSVLSDSSNGLSASLFVPSVA